MKNQLLKLYCAAAVSFMALSQSASAQNQDAGDVLDRLNSFGTQTQNLIVTFSQIAGLIMLIVGIFIVAKKETSPSQQSNRGWGFVSMIAGGALFTILTIRQIMGSSITG